MNAIIQKKYRNCTLNIMSKQTLFHEFKNGTLGNSPKLKDDQHNKISVNKEKAYDNIKNISDAFFVIAKWDYK